METSMSINGHTIFAKKARYEYAWHISETPELCVHLASQGNVIYGGDILDDQLEYTHSNWYYDEVITLTQFENAQKSLAVALNYIERFVKQNGTAFYVVVVAE